MLTILTPPHLAPEKPPYPIFAKRPAHETSYYETFNLPNVSLIDLQTDPIHALTPTGILTTLGLHINLDIIILATGFDAVNGGLGSIAITGLDTSTTLSQFWNTAGGKSTYLGLSVSSYPNPFFPYGPQSPGGWCNGPACAQYQGDWIANTLSYMRERGKKRIDALLEAQQKWSEQVKAIAAHTVLPRAESWQFGANVPGAVREPLFFLGGVGTYLGRLEEVEGNGYEGFVLS